MLNPVSTSASNVRTSRQISNAKQSSSEKQVPGKESSAVTDLKNSHIVVVDDTQANLVLLKSLLDQDGYSQISLVSNAVDAVDFIVETKPELVLLDLNMPYMSGLAILEHLATNLSAEVRPAVIVLTGDAREDSKVRALGLGASDVIMRPFSKDEVLLKVRNTLKGIALQAQAHEDKNQLERLVAERTRQLELTQIEMLARLARVAEYRDDQAGEHIWRVARLSGQIAEVLGLDADYAALRTRAARLHDVGKIAIPDGILFKPGKLTAAEFDIVKKHTVIGAEMLSGGQSELLRLAESVARGHHERWDGGGYPLGLAGDDIPLECRIVALADAFDAITHDQAHRKALSVQAALDIISEESGKQFDPRVVRAFLTVMAR